MRIYRENNVLLSSALITQGTNHNLHISVTVELQELMEASTSLPTHKVNQLPL